MIKLWCVSQSACLTAVDDFVLAEEKKDLAEILYFRKRNKKFYLIVDNQCKERFLEFVQKKPYYNSFFHTELIFDEVRGFVSEEAGVEAIETFNEAKPDLYIDSSEPLSEVITNKGVLYMPYIADCQLENSFWNFVNRRGDILENVIVGRERC